MKKYFYERNSELLEHPVNITFEKALWMTKEEFRAWVIELRETVVDLWDNKGLPPRVGYSEEGIVDQFNKIDSFPVHEFECVDELTGENDCIRNTSVIGNAANQFFPTMMATKISYTLDGGASIYDYFADPKRLDTFVTYASRHFKRDSFYHYSNPLKLGDNEILFSESAEDWIRKFESTKRIYNTHDYWLAPKKDDAEEYSGYNEALIGVEYYTLNKEQIESLPIPEKCKTNVDYSKCETYQIRPFKLGQKLFPIGLKAFRVSFCQYAVNFPPLTAKYLYEKYTEDLKDQEVINVYDPSSGWGGRILGAMGIKSDRNIHYIGTDPNTDHNTENGRTKYHELADFYNTRTYRSESLFPHVNTYEIFQDGSEVIRDNPAFQKYKGNLDFIFTSPPYFAKEVYSQDPTQSCHKFQSYDSWRDGFLRPTLETCVEWLKCNRYMAWNIADVDIGKDRLPLEQDSINILESLGMKYITKLKMVLAPMPGSNRIVDGKPKFKNFCKINGKFFKFEPVYIFFKP